MTIPLPVAEPVDFLQLPFGALAGAASDALLLLDAQQRIVAVNEAGLQMFGRSEAEMAGQPLSSLIPPSRRQAHEAQVRAFEASGRRQLPALMREPVLGLRANGEEFPVEVSISRIDLLVDAQPRRYSVALLRDLGGSRGLRAEMLALTTRLRGVLDLTPVAIWIVDGEQLVYANHAAAALFGVPDLHHLVGRSIGTLLQVNGPMSLPSHLARAARDVSQPDLLSGQVLRPDGQFRQVEIATAALPDHGATVMQMVIIDVSESRAQAQEQSQHRQELRRLAASVVEAREEERRRIARELHDELGQRLTALKLELASLRSEDAGGPDTAGRAARIAGMMEMVDNTVAALRRIAVDLRPLMLDDLGLNAAIESLARDAARRMDMEVTVQLDRDDPPLAPGADIALYRMVQEALTNVGRHAGATDVRIELGRDGDELVLTVHDNGRGFPERAMRQEGRYGLLGMRERALMLGGRLEVDNPPGGGGRITVRLPLKLDHALRGERA